jgi:hypothetical protein
MSERCGTSTVAALAVGMPGLRLVMTAPAAGTVVRALAAVL